MFLDGEYGVVMIRVLLVYNLIRIRNELSRILARSEEIEIVGLAATMQETLMNAVHGKPDVIIMDLDTPGLEPPIIIQRPDVPHAAIPVIIFTSHPENVDAGRLLRTGAKGYIATQAMETVLIDAVRAVYHGGRYVCRFLENAFMRSYPRETARSHGISRLTSREQMIFRLLAVGQSTRQVAEDLGLSRKTVSTHRAHVLAKLGLRNNAELARYAAMNDLIRS